MSIESVMPSNHLIFCHPLLPSIFSSIRVFSNESVLHMWCPKYWSFSLSISTSNGLAGQGILKSLLQHDMVQRHQFFGAQLSSQSNFHIHMTIGKTIDLPRQTMVGKVISLLFNMLSKLVITFLPRSKHLLISWLSLGFRNN